MEFFKSVMLLSWNSISGPKIEHLWLPNSHPLVYSPEEVKGYPKGFDVPKDSISPLNFTGGGSASNLDSKKSKVTQSQPASSSPKPINVYLLNIQKCLNMSGKLLISEIETRKLFLETKSKLYCLGNDIVFSVVFYKRPWSTAQSVAESLCSCLSIMLTCDMLFTFDIQRIVDLHLRKAASLMQRSVAPPSSVAVEVSAIIYELCQVAFSVQNRDSSVQVSPSPKFLKFQAQMKFLARAITSHLQTCGYSVVTGDSRFTVNQLAHILLLFNSEQERLCSEANMMVVQRQYSSGLHVQAIPKTHNAAFLPDAVFRDYPISVIDTDWQKVRQTLPDSAEECNSNVLKSVTDAGTLVPQLLEDLIFLEENGSDVRNIVGSFCRFLNIKAVSLTKMCEGYRSNGHMPTVKELMNILNVETVSDLRIIMGYAEKLQPGISVILMKIVR